jgi:4-diphosphocytidyl-2-C-methyl-D-erythritol kinase
LGSVLGVLRWSPGEAMLDSGNGKVQRFSSVDELMAQATGAAVPVTALFAWLRGDNASASGWSADLSRHAEGRISAKRTVQPAPRRPTCVSCSTSSRARPLCAPTRLLAFMTSCSLPVDDPLRLPPAPCQPLKALYDVPAPAKLNLFLHITGRRPDGYHLLQSVFMLIDWCDTLHFELRTDGQISREDLGDEGNAGESQVLPAEDLCVRAARALQAACGTLPGGSYRPAKADSFASRHGRRFVRCRQLPAGLAAAVGRAPAAARTARHRPFAGRRCAFFPLGGHAWVEGIGEKITPLALPPARFVVVKPPAGLPTQGIFSAPGLKRDTETATIQGFAANAEGHVEISRFRIWPQRLAAGSAGDVPADWPVARLAENEGIFKGA